ncbi:hypothetical protein [Burkholderia pseudomallei]|uniref:hypothetical protein n=2 Tax=Burkholderia pseudomallei TaxID=28450 RepID=UPI0022EB3CB4|nr:hypothetical protein [Burkholderia pseudomallei]
MKDVVWHRHVRTAIASTLPRVRWHAPTFAVVAGRAPRQVSSLMKSNWVPPGAVSSAMVWRLFWNDLRDARAGGEHCFGFAGGDGLGGKMGCGKNMDSIFY